MQDLDVGLLGTVPERAPNAPAADAAPEVGADRPHRPGSPHAPRRPAARLVPAALRALPDAARLEREGRAAGAGAFGRPAAPRHPPMAARISRWPPPSRSAGCCALAALGGVGAAALPRRAVRRRARARDPRRAAALRPARVEGRAHRPGPLRGAAGAAGAGEEHRPHDRPAAPGGRPGRRCAWADGDLDSLVAAGLGFDLAAAEEARRRGGPAAGAAGHGRAAGDEARARA